MEKINRINQVNIAIPKSFMKILKERKRLTKAHSLAELWEQDIERADDFVKFKRKGAYAEVLKNQNLSNEFLEIKNNISTIARAVSIHLEDFKNIKN